MTAITSFKIAVPEARLADLQQRVRNTLLAATVPGTGWEAGPTAEFVTGMLDRLANGYDWRANEAAINGHPQFTTEIDGQNIHFLHVKSKTASATPTFTSNRTIRHVRSDGPNSSCRPASRNGCPGP